MPAARPRRIVLLSGWLKSGKDTVGEYLCRAHGFRRLAFADALKDEVSETYGIPRDLLDSQDGKDLPVGSSGQTVRDLLIRHGQWRRSQDPAYWIHKVLREIQQATGHIVITDWRFPHEFDVIDSAVGGGAEKWRVQRWAAPPKLDESEVALDSMQFGVTLANTGTLADLYAQVDSHMGALSGRCSSFE